MASIRVEWIAHLHESQVEPLRALLMELTQVVPIPPEVASLEIRVVPPRSTGEAANRILGQEVYGPLSPAPGALILPIDQEDSLSCIVLIGREEFEGLSATRRPDGLVSSLLEELLHAQVYGVRWRHAATIFVDRAGQDAPLEIIASRIHDEYVVSRAKNELSSSLPLFDAPGMPGYRVMRVFAYDGKLATIMYEAQTQVEERAKLFRNGDLGIDELRVQLAHDIIFRKIMDPLSRSHGFMEGMPAADQQRLPLILPSGDFYKELIAPCWLKIHEYVQGSYASGLRNAHYAIPSMAYELRLLAQDLEEHVRFSLGD